MKERKRQQDQNNTLNEQSMRVFISLVDFIFFPNISLLFCSMNELNK